MSANSLSLNPRQDINAITHQPPVEKAKQDPKPASTEVVDFDPKVKLHCVYSNYLSYIDSSGKEINRYEKDFPSKKYLESFIKAFANNDKKAQELALTFMKNFMEQSSNETLVSLGYQVLYDRSFNEVDISGTGSTSRVSAIGHQGLLLLNLAGGLNVFLISLTSAG